MEIWKDINGYEGYYQVSNMGNFKSVDRCVLHKNNRRHHIKGINLRATFNNRIQRYEISLSKEGKRKVYKTYRLVAEMFVENSDPIHKTVVNHIDGNTHNNISTNLEWVTHSENLQHSYDVLHRVVNKPYRGKRKCRVYDKINNTLTEYASIMEASRNIQISETQIRRVSDKECINDRFDIEIQ